jgi:hypothetical protein
MQLSEKDDPPFRWAAGADAVETFERKGKELIEQANAYRDLSSSLAIDDAAESMKVG